MILSHAFGFTLYAAIALVSGVPAFIMIETIVSVSVLSVLLRALTRLILWR